MKPPEINTDPMAAKLLSQCRQQLEDHLGYPVLLTAQPAMHLDNVDAKQFIQDCADEFGIPLPDLLQPDRTSTVLAARQATVYTLFTYSSKGVKEVGRAVGQHHSSIIHTVHKMRSYLYVKDKIALYNLGVIKAMIAKKYYPDQELNKQ